MPDISMCMGTDCPLKKKCRRFTSTPNGTHQSWFTSVPITIDKKGKFKCENFWKIEK